MKSSKQNRLQVIEKAIREAHQYALEHCGLPLNKMPEYFLGVAIGRTMVAEFSNFKVRFEMSVLQLLDHLGVEPGDDPDDREKGRFDVVLMTKRKQVPAHIIEIKRSVKVGSMLADIRRLANVCRLAKIGERLETNYFVVVTARSEDVVLGRVKKLLSSDIDQVLQDIRLHQPVLISLDVPDAKAVTAAIYAVSYCYN